MSFKNILFFLLDVAYFSPTTYSEVIETVAWLQVCAFAGHQPLSSQFIYNQQIELFVSEVWYQILYTLYYISQFIYNQQIEVFASEVWYQVFFILLVTFLSLSIISKSKCSPWKFGIRSYTLYVTFLSLTIISKSKCSPSKFGIRSWLSAFHYGSQFINDQQFEVFVWKV